jgi:hypothetical protein
MRFSQVSELVSYLIDSQRASGQLYKRIAHQCDAERVRMFLHYLEQRQQAFQEYLERIRSDSPKAALSTWLNLERPDIERWCQEYDVPPQLNVENILELSQELDLRQQDLLKSACRELPLGAAKMMLENLLEHLLHRQQQFVHSAHRMDDL